MKQHPKHHTSVGARGVGGAAVAIAGKPQLLAQARTLLAKNDTK